MGRIGAGRHRIETPVGTVTAGLHDNGHVTVGNVPATAARRAAAVDVPGHGDVHGDVAWGGNWFFLFTTTARADWPSGGTDGFRLGHPRGAARARRHGRGRRRDRPHRTVRPAHGPAPTAKLRALPRQSLRPFALRHRHQRQAGLPVGRRSARPGQPYRQQSIVGSVFEGYVEERDGKLWPFIRGSAFVTAEGRLVLEESDPFRWGIRP